jgi:predicted GIY-YIG superfamily endonuclease
MVSTREAALREERAFKALSRQKKIAFLEEFTQAGPSGPLRDCASAASGKG